MEVLTAEVLRPNVMSCGNILFVIVRNCTASVLHTIDMTTGVSLRDVHPDVETVIGSIPAKILKHDASALSTIMLFLLLNGFGVGETYDAVFGNHVPKYDIQSVYNLIAGRQDLGGHSRYEVDKAFITYYVGVGDINMAVAIAGGDRDLNKHAIQVALRR